MRPLPWILAEPHRIKHPMAPQDYGDDFGSFVFKRNGVKLCCIVSKACDQYPWDHVSVSTKHRCPNWDEMCFIKEIFFDDEEAVMQFHPPKSEYINCHPYTLHMWRPTQEEIPKPPSILVGPDSAKKYKR